MLFRGLPEPSDDPAWPPSSANDGLSVSRPTYSERKGSIMGMSGRGIPPYATPLEVDACIVSPLEVLRFEHFRQRRLCDLLGRVADDLHRTDAPKNAAWILNYLQIDLPLHIEEENQDLVPLLLACGDGDETVSAACDALVRDHESHDQEKLMVTAGLERLATYKPLERPLDFIINALIFQEKFRRHVIWENRVVLPLAQRRLNAADLAWLGRRMACRRGFSPHRARRAIEASGPIECLS